MGEVYELNAREVAYENLQGDVVLVHFKTGCYYSVRGLSAWVFQQFLDGFLPRDIARALAHPDQLSEKQLEAELKQFADNLLAEQLLSKTSALLEQRSCASPPADLDYQAPLFEKFEDMADQILLDKIQEQLGDPQTDMPQ